MPIFPAIHSVLQTMALFDTPQTFVLCWELEQAMGAVAVAVELLLELVAELVWAAAQVGSWRHSTSPLFLLDGVVELRVSVTLSVCVLLLVVEFEMFRNVGLNISSI